MPTGHSLLEMVLALFAFLTHENLVLTPPFLSKSTFIHFLLLQGPAGYLKYLTCLAFDTEKCYPWPPIPHSNCTAVTMLYYHLISLL